jgi:acyl-CoA reductase-like NAD-dependent aldehyde dehydrogenase
MHAIAKPEVEHVKCFAAGEWIDSTDRIEVYNPFTNQLVGTVPKLSARQVEQAVDALAAYKPKLIRTSTRRGSLQGGAGREGAQGRDRHGHHAGIGDVAQEQPRRSRPHVRPVADGVGGRKRIMGEQIPSDTDSAGRNKMILAMRFPVGVVTAIVAFNRPLNQVTVKIAPSFAAGNKTIVKPSSHVPLSSFRLLKILLESGMPPEMISIVTGSSSEISAALVTNKNVDMVTFTGSTEVGRRLTQIAGIKRVTIEAGGNDPLILCEDANLDKAVEIAVAGAYGNAGRRPPRHQRTRARGRRRRIRQNLSKNRRPSNAATCSSETDTAR